MLSPGTQVRVRDDWPEARGPCHIRTPHYLRGRPGTVIRHLGRFPNPEDLAFARPAPLLDLYHVAFPSEALWPGAAPTELPPTELPPAELLVELYEPWLELNP